MFQVMLEYDEPWSDGESHRVEAHFTCEIAIAPIIAQRRARTFLAMAVTMMTRVGIPVLVLGERPVWRVPAYFSVPHLGEVGTLGAIEVDARSGEIIPLTPEQIAAMQNRAHAIATCLTSPAVATS